jgi:uncharacterized iron-regulated membrane protein
MKNLLSPRLVKRSLEGHSWIGLLVGALMYIVCLTGTLSVLYPEFERWEQPQVREGRELDIAAIEAGFNRFLAGDQQRTPHMYLNFPTEEMPRASFSNEEVGWFVGQDGTRGERVDHEWTHFLLDAHLYLTLPGTWGIVLVSALGVMLFSLIVSGFLSHPRIFKDAFRLRLGGRDRLEQVDLHNRLSVWGAPFYVIIALTGAYFGLVIPVLDAVGGMTGREGEKLSAVLFPEEQAVEGVGPVRLASMLETLAAVEPGAEPLGLTVHEAGTDEQFVEIYASHPGRMIYSDSYRFESGGRYLGNVGYSDGEAGKQIVYSMYRLHFGHFGGFAVKLLYVVLGLALTVVSVTGINIWLAKRRRVDVVNDAWVGIVWGVPLALIATMLTQITAGFASVPLFWTLVLGVVGWCARASDPTRAKQVLPRVLVAACGVALAAHVARFGSDAVGPAAIRINTGLLLVMAGLAAYAVATRGGLPTPDTDPSAEPRAAFSPQQTRPSASRQATG